MPADVSYLCGVSPPFAYGNNILQMHHEQQQSYYSATSCGVLNPQTLNRVPRYPLKNLKSCLKAFQQADVISDLNDSKRKIHREYENHNSVDLVSENQTCKLAKKEKHVTFADTQGGALTLIKYLTESTNEPPKSFTSGDLLEDLMKNLNLPSLEQLKKRNDEHKLLLKFEQPVADYVSFKRKIDTANVSLENVVLKDNCCIHGTVKVKNISFDKVVTIRITFDDWRTHTDICCNYVKNAYETGTFDTFQFDIDIPNSFFASESTYIQFCVSYSCGDTQFWDNNGGKNYLIAALRSSANNTQRSASISIPGRNIETKRSINVSMLSVGRSHTCAAI